MTQERKKSCLLLSLQAPKMPGGGGEIRSYFLTLMAAKMFDVTLISLGGSDGRGRVPDEIRARCLRVIEPVESFSCRPGAVRQIGRLGRWWSFLRTLIWPAGNLWNDYLGLLLQYGQSTAPGRKRLICLLLQWHFRIISLFAWMPPVTSLLFRDPWLRVEEEVIAEISGKRFDVLWVEHTLVWPFVSRLQNLINSDYRMICSGHNIEWHLLARQASNARERAAKWYYRGQARLMRRMELKAWSRADVNLQCSPVDAAVVGKAIRGPVVMISNGVNVNYFCRGSETSLTEESLVLFTAGFGYAPNQEALFWFLEYVLPLLRQRSDGVLFLFAGSQANGAARAAGLVANADATHAGVEWISDPVDIRPCFERACVYVVPILSGGGSRLKILEAMSMGIPVVSTRVGAEGVPYQSGEHLLLADSPVEFAEAVLRLLRDRGLRQSLSEAGRQFVERNYQWETLCEQAAGQILNLIEDVNTMASEKGFKASGAMSK